MKKLYAPIFIVLATILINYSCQKEDSATTTTTTGTQNATGSNNGNTTSGTNNSSSSTVDSGTTSPGAATPGGVSYQSFTGTNGTYQYAMSGNKRVVNIVVPNAIWNKCISQYNGLLGGNTIDPTDAADVTKNIIYSQFKDDFDFIFLINNTSTKGSNQPYGLNITIARRDNGITTASRKYDSSSDFLDNNYTRSSKLISFMFLPYKDALIKGPSLHEICHNWANLTPRGGSYTDGGTCIFTMNGTTMAHDGHWGFSNVGGQLGGFDASTFQSLGNNQYHGNITGLPGFGVTANGGNSIPYSKLELYLMGLIPKTDVPNIKVFSGVSNASAIGDTGNFTASTVNEYTIDQLISTTGIGERNPDYTASKKTYRGIVVVLSPSQLTSTEWSDYENQINSFFMAQSDGTDLYNFWEATGGRARIDVFNLNSSLK